MKREAEFTTLFRHWLKVNPLPSGGFELKATTKDSIPFSAVKEHQIDGLMAAKRTGILYKAPDDSRGIKPFDMFYLRCAQAYVVIRFPKVFCMIDIEQFVKEQKKSIKKSLTVERAIEIAVITVKLKNRLK